MKRTVALCTLLVVLTACGGDGGRPSADEIADALKDADNPMGQAFPTDGTTDEAIDCIAEALHDSELSDDAIQAIVDGDEDFDGNGDDQEVISSPELAEDIAACVTA